MKLLRSPPSWQIWLKSAKYWKMLSRTFSHTYSRQDPMNLAVLRSQAASAAEGKHCSKGNAIALAVWERFTSHPVTCRHAWNSRSNLYPTSFDWSALFSNKVAAHCDFSLQHQIPTWSKGPKQELHTKWNILHTIYIFPSKWIDMPYLRRKLSTGEI